MYLMQFPVMAHYKSFFILAVILNKLKDPQAENLLLVPRATNWVPHLQRSFIAPKVGYRLR